MHEQANLVQELQQTIGQPAALAAVDDQLKGRVADAICQMSMVSPCSCCNQLCLEYGHVHARCSCCMLSVLFKLQADTTTSYRNSTVVAGRLQALQAVEAAC